MFYCTLSILTIDSESFHLYTLLAHYTFLLLCLFLKQVLTFVNVLLVVELLAFPSIFLDLGVKMRL